MARRPHMRDATRARALDALAALRHPEQYGRMSARDAAGRFGSSLDSMRRVAGRSLRKERGEWIYHPHDDQAVRTASIPAQTPDGPRWVQVKVRGLTQASKAGRFASAIERSQWSRIEQFKGKYISDTSGRRWYFETNRAALQRLDREGGLRPKGLQFT